MFKTIRNIGFVVLLVYVWYVFCSKDEEPEEQIIIEEKKPPDTFRPTKEWQVVKKGQPIPPGLHVRMNLETGVTEAKLLDEDSKDDNEKTQALTVHEDEGKHFVENSKLFKPSELKEAMKNIKGDDIINPDDLKQITKKFRKYDEIKKELDEINLIPKTEAELLQHIVKQLKEYPDISRDKTLKLLEDLDFLVHQIDNAVEFAKQDGFADIVYKFLNSSDVNIKTDTLKLFSSLVQNNPKVKIDAVETGGINILLKIMSLDTNENVKIRATTALSCLLRRFPYAQLKFVENGGLTVVTQLFELNNVKLKIKLVTLVSDLLAESQDTDVGSEFHIKQQYKLVNLEDRLQDHNWCENLKNLLDVLIVTDKEEHDSIEKCLLSIKAVIKKCGKHFQRDVFEKLEKRYRLLAKMDEGKDEEVSNMDYFIELSEICSDISKYIPVQANSKTEL